MSGTTQKPAPAKPDLSDTGRISVVLGQFSALIGRGLIQLLEEDKSLQIIDSDLNDDALESTIATHVTNVAILDEMSVAKSSLLKRLLAAQPKIGVVVLAYRSARMSCTQLFVAGAIRLSKDACAVDVLAAVHLAAGDRPRHVGVASLTSREVDVLELLSLGDSYIEIARTLSIGVETVRTHAAGVRRKLGVRSKWELIGLPIPGQSYVDMKQAISNPHAPAPR